MGHGNFVICESCGYQREFMLGAGMMYGNLQNILEFMTRTTRKKFPVSWVFKILKREI